MAQQPMMKNSFSDNVVPQNARDGRGSEPRQAMQYANSIPFNKKDMSGCRVVWCGSVPVALSCNFFCGDGVLCMPPCIFGCFPFPCICSCERTGNVFVTRGRGFEKNGACMVADTENHTMACYSYELCDYSDVSNPPTGEQCLYCKRVC